MGFDKAIRKPIPLIGLGIKVGLIGYGLKTLKKSIPTKIKIKRRKQNVFI